MPSTLYTWVGLCQQNCDITNCHEVGIYEINGLWVNYGAFQRTAIAYAPPWNVVRSQMAYGSFLRSLNCQTHLSILNIQKLSISLSHLFFITEKYFIGRKTYPLINRDGQWESVGWFFFCVITKGFVGWPKASQSRFNFG